MKMRILFHLKWLFKKRYEILFSFDPAIKNNENIVCMKHDKKYDKIKIIR